MSDKDAVDTAEILRKRIEEHVFPDVGKITISAGVITVQGENDYKDVFMRIDKALYDAKNGGRNRVVQSL